MTLRPVLKKNISEAEKTRRNFIEQKKKRKEQLEGSSGNNNIPNEDYPKNVEEKGSDKPKVTEKTKPAEENLLSQKLSKKLQLKKVNKEKKGQIKEESTQRC
ncbi:ALI_HP2_G0016830.mRNA.1.CDS.1 [Saccharomyces cerevisiae]|nr:ALI_HP2_G0016830.mRNA.1.CDS.1 [Saccharomyces cerevisiae]CAI6487390.1 ALI_HP2_G0016830.mRNA.1.CDS.1 [Saccharomyces cerevisiae]